MDYDKLIDAVKLCGSTPKVAQCKQCAYWAGGDMSKCIPKMTADAAIAIKALRADLARVAAERDAAKSPEVLEAVDELVEFARTRMCIADWLYYVEVLGEWRGDDMVVEQNWVDHEGIEGPEGKEDWS